MTFPLNLYSLHHLQLQALVAVTIVVLNLFWIQTVFFSFRRLPISSFRVYYHYLHREIVTRCVPSHHRRWGFETMLTSRLCKWWLFSSVNQQAKQPICFTTVRMNMKCYLDMHKSLCLLSHLRLMHGSVSYPAVWEPEAIKDMSKELTPCLWWCCGQRDWLFPEPSIREWHSRAWCEDPWRWTSRAKNLKSPQTLFQYVSDVSLALSDESVSETKATDQREPPFESLEPRYKISFILPSTPIMLPSSIHYFPLWFTFLIQNEH